jgi:hypothetical protein
MEHVVSSILFETTRGLCMFRKTSELVGQMCPSASALYNNICITILSEENQFVHHIMIMTTAKAITMERPVLPLKLPAPPCKTAMSFLPSFVLFTRLQIGVTPQLPDKKATWNLSSSRS